RRSEATERAKGLDLSETQFEFDTVGNPSASRQLRSAVQSVFSKQVVKGVSAASVMMPTGRHSRVALEQPDSALEQAWSASLRAPVAAPASWVRMSSPHTSSFWVQDRAP